MWYTTQFTLFMHKFNQWSSYAQLACVQYVNVEKHFCLFEWYTEDKKVYGVSNTYHRSCISFETGSLSLFSGFCKQQPKTRVRDDKCLLPVPCSYQTVMLNVLLLPIFAISIHRIFKEWIFFGPKSTQPNLTLQAQ